MNTQAIAQTPTLLESCANFGELYGESGAYQVVLVVKNPPVNAHKRHKFSPWVGKILWRRTGQPTPVFLPRESLWTEEPGGLFVAHRVAKIWT